jgi:hypothetical protein
LWSFDNLFELEFRACKAVGGGSMEPRYIGIFSK